MKLKAEQYMELEFESYLKARISRIEAFLSKILNAFESTKVSAIETTEETKNTETNLSSLLKALRYSSLGGGKRLRALLVYATGETLGSSLEYLDAAAAAVEFIHCYSLIHDDLPAMDNDDLRRGKPSCHKAFDEATAILAGDALQALAFQVLADPSLNLVSAQQQVQMIYTLAKNSGYQGMVGGQALDIAFTNNQPISFNQLCAIHQKKTGALIEAAVALGALAALDVKEKKNLQDNQILLNLETFARCLGLAFQIQDDILDIVSDTQTLGKSAGKDQQQNKTTFPRQMGLKAAKQYASTLHQQALESIAFLNEKSLFLAKISEYFIHTK